MLPVCEGKHDFTGEMKWKSFCRNKMLQYSPSLKLSKILDSFLFLFTYFFFSIFNTNMLKIDHPPHQFYNFVICESYILGNFDYWSCGKVNIRGSKEQQKFLPCLLILCVYHCISYIQICQLAVIDLRDTFIFAIVHWTFHCTELFSCGHQTSFGRLTDVYMKSRLHIDVHWTSKGCLMPTGSNSIWCRSQKSS